MTNSLFSWFFQPERREADLTGLNPFEQLFLKKISGRLNLGTAVTKHQEVEINGEKRMFNFILSNGNGKKTEIEFEVGQYNNKKKIPPGYEKIPVSCQLDSMYRFTSPDILPFLDDCIYFIQHFDRDLFDRNRIRDCPNLMIHDKCVSESTLSVIQYNMRFEESQYGYLLSLIRERRTKHQPWPDNWQSNETADNQTSYKGRFAPEKQKPNAEHFEPEKPDDFETILDKFMVKSRIKQHWRYPLYDSLISFVYYGEFDAASSVFKKADKEDPDGCFMEKEAFYALEGEKAGRFPKGLYVYYKQIELNRELTEQRKLEIATEITQNVPGFAPGWLALATHLPETEDQLYAIEQGLSKNPDQTTKGLLLLNKAFALSASGQNNEAIKILGEIIGTPELTSTNITMAKMALRHFKKNELFGYSSS